MTPNAWQQMPFFLAVAREGSLRAAAAALGTTHVKVNRQIRALESAYGVELIRRAQRGVTLTEAGKKLLPLAEEADQVFMQADRSLQGMDRQERGDIRFSVSGPLATFVAAPILTAFSRAYPLVNLIIHVSTAFEDPTLIETDVGLRVVYDVHEDAVVKKLFPVSLGTYASVDYIHDTLPNAGPRGAGLAWIGSVDAQDTAQWVSTSPFPDADVHHNLSDPILHRELAAQGLGMTRLAHFMATGDPRLAQVPGTEIEDGPPLCLIIHPELRRTLRVRRFVDFLETGLRQRRADIHHR